MHLYRIAAQKLKKLWSRIHYNMNSLQQKRATQTIATHSECTTASDKQLLNIKNYFIPLPLICFVILFFTSPTTYMQSFFDGLAVWAKNVLPAIFPFALLSSLTLGKASTHCKKSITAVLFGLRCDGLYAVSLLCGYPIGARLISQSQCNAQTCKRLTAFCSTPSPIFMAATVGLLLNNVKATAILITSQILGSIMNGMLFRKEKDDVRIQALTNKGFTDAVIDCILSSLCVGALIAVAFMLTAMLQALLPQDIKTSPFVYFALGLIEMTSGCIGICNVCSLTSATVLSSVLLAFGGICVALQSITFLSQKGVKLTDYLLRKITQAAFCGFFALILCLLFL